MNYLLYTLVNFRSEPYLAIFVQFLKALIAFSDLNAFELCIITDESIAPNIKKLNEIKKFPNVSYIIVSVNASLEVALLRKFDITLHPEFLRYDKILYLDCDILVKGNIIRLFKAIDTKDRKLYVAKEGKLDGKYWRLNAFANNTNNMMKDHKESFNSGEYIFKPSLFMKNHFEAAKHFGLNNAYSTFYDQPVFNYYFNKYNISEVSPYLSRVLKMFPDPSKQYPQKLLLHFAGISRYQEKEPIMKAYLKKITSKIV